MPKFTVKMIYTATFDAANKIEATLMAEECLKDATVVPELIVTRFKAPKSVPADKRTGSLFPTET